MSLEPSEHTGPVSTSAAYAIEILGLTKVYGETRALDGVDLSVPSGSVFGFLGPNGAGKTTTLRVLTGLSRPTAGRARIFGDDVVKAGNEARAVVGYLPDVPGFYDWMDAEEFLRLAGGLFGLKGRPLAGRVDALLDLAGLRDVKTRIGGYSRGMRQRLGIAQALVNAPRLLMLDEPTSALDPIGRKEVLDMIASLAGRTTVFFSTHILADVERVCDTVAILDRGRVVTQSPMKELAERFGAQRLVVEVDGDASALASEMSARPWTSAVDVSEGTLSISVNDIDAARREIPGLVAASGRGLVRFESGEVDLEEIFVDLVQGARR